ncbi:FKBP-type peptidyl-prolyl cis-trans isomerase [Marinicellulosiphila megalodicopiae]|uniref:FKBP-type peptidyl-prolyl cis-trans isomerase n=1 Tax=Marinicellulosiphila megalodicopiae TaxID=2724896 RepID=UPI003BB1C0B9
MQFTFHYWLQNSEGEVVDTSQGGEPLCLQKGSGKIVQGLEEALIAHNAGDKFEVLVPCEKAYGPLKEDLVTRFPLTMFDQVENLNVGMMFQTGEGKDAQVVKVVHIDDKGVIVDANHPLVGLDLRFQVELISKEG